ncbi:MAG: TonB-dependent receptor [Acidobacteriales bacterium]|nr:TonB-dependent receptor [Terriglobales bacterium]
MKKLLRATLQTGRRRVPAIAVLILTAAAIAFATILGSVRGLIHDPQHRPVTGAIVRLRAVGSAFEQTVTSNDAGEFVLEKIPIGEYTATVQSSGFRLEEQRLALASGRDVRLHFSLKLATASETVEVTDEPVTVNPASSTSATLISRADIAQTPGADQTNSLAMITSSVPGASVVHDQLHIRGGHQVSWLLDGVPVPNTNIASNVGPQFDPKDIDYLEVQRGGYNAEYGDRTYGVFNVVTRSGFERNRQAELVASYGSFHNTDNQISFGDHSERLAYYGSFSGYRTDLGLETLIARVVHDQAAGLGGFGSIIFNKSANDQLRLVTSLRGDHYQVPNDPADPASADNRDRENERDAFANFSWVHTARPGLTLTLSPFYHFNRAHYLGKFVGTFDGNPDDAVAIPEDDRGSTFFGGTAMVSVLHGKHNARAGAQAWGQRDNQLFGVVSSDPSQIPLHERVTAHGSVTAVFLEDQYRVTDWLTLNAGVRLTHFESSVSENAADPRVGAAVRIPKLGWVARAFYGRYYQAPPLLTVSGPLIEQCNAADCTFLPLHGERDEQREFGLAIPLKGWTFDVANFRTGARNFFDHDALGNSNIFFPLTLEHARIRGWEVSASSPRLANRVSWRLVYSHQYAQWNGGITGGLTTGDSCEDPLCFLDHDQRNTLSTSLNVSLPWRVWADFGGNYGSGFVDGDGPAHLPSHTTYDLSLGKTFGENWSLRLNGLNLGNHHYLLDNSNTFGGTHFANPREISVQVKFRFRY